MQLTEPEILKTVVIVRGLQSAMPLKSLDNLGLDYLPQALRNNKDRNLYCYEH